MQIFSEVLVLFCCRFSKWLNHVAFYGRWRKRLEHRYGCTWLYTPRITIIKEEKDKMCFWVRPTSMNRKICEGDELLWICGVMTSDWTENRNWSSRILFRISREGFEKLKCIVVQQLTRKIQTLKMQSVWRNAWQ
jgi:hypothetical protein